MFISVPIDEIISLIIDEIINSIDEILISVIDEEAEGINRPRRFS